MHYLLTQFQACSPLFCDVPMLLVTYGNLAIHNCYIYLSPYPLFQTLKLFLMPEKKENLVIEKH